MGFLERLGLRRQEAANESSSGVVRAIEDRLADLGAERGGRVAVFAALLGRVAYADEEIDDAEERRVAEVVQSHAGLTAEEAATVAMIARERTVALRGTGKNEATRRFNEVASKEEKLRLLECLFAVATADDLVSHVEDREIRQIGRALLLPSKTVLEVRSRYRERLEEIQALRRTRKSRDA